jgi:iron complex outermembrane recepter protein
MKFLIILFLFFVCIVLAQNHEIQGKVIDTETGNPLQGANIYFEKNPSVGTATDSQGNFEIKNNFSENDYLIISYLGYNTKRLSLSNLLSLKQIVIKLEPQIIPSQTVLVEGSVGKEGVTPLTFSKIKRKSIEEKYTVQDIPEFLSSLPSTTFYSENGNGIGYNYLSIRGFDQRRISVSINGIPQNDPEDHNVYWLDFPDLLASTDLIQVQRGAGSGVSGYPAIGGSINIITSNFSNDPMVNFSASAGSYNVRKYSASFSSGLIDKKYSIYAKLSQILSSGYRNMSWVKFNSYYLSAVRYDKNLTTQINFYGGPIADGLAYTGLPKFAVKNKELRRANYSYWETDDQGNYTYTLNRRPDEIENFTQPHYELLNELQLNKNLTLNSALFLVTGDGFFDFDGSWADTSYLRLTKENGFMPDGNPQNVLIRVQVENRQFGWIPRLSYKHDGGELIIGGEFRKHKSIHWGSINYGENLPAGLNKDFRYYFFNGGKDIINGFVHETYNVNENLNLLGEIQLAYNKYKLYNEKYLNNDFSISNFFFNPRLGINFKFNPYNNIYFSFARVSREPRLVNYYDASESSGGAQPQFELNPDGTFNFNKPLVKPETMNDFELGSAFTTDDYSFSINLFYMLFDNEIVSNGQVDRFGQPVTGNVKSTIHKGIELSGNAKFLDGFEALINATYSSNKISEGSTFISYPNPNNSDQSVVSAIDLSVNRISGFPDFLANAGISYNKNGIFLQLLGKYIGSFFSDNYDDKLKIYSNLYPGFIDYADNKNDAYFTANFYGSYEVNIFNSLNPSKIYLQVENIFDNLYSAYAIGKEFFPVAERNFLAGLQIGL